MDESSHSQNRRSRRSPVLLAASIEVDGVPEPVKLRNLSEAGALVEGERLPPEGAETFFQRGELGLKGQVVWVQGKYAGVAFDTPLNRDEVLRQVPQPKAKTYVEYRRPGFNSRPLSAYDRQMLETWMASVQIGLIDD